MRFCKKVLGVVLGARLGEPVVRHIRVARHLFQRPFRQRNHKGVQIAEIVIEDRSHLQQRFAHRSFTPGLVLHPHAWVLSAPVEPENASQPSEASTASEARGKSKVIQRNNDFTVILFTLLGMSDTWASNCIVSYCRQRLFSPYNPANQMLRHRLTNAAQEIASPALLYQPTNKDFRLPCRPPGG